MKVGDTVKVRTAGHGEENVTVLNIEHPENEGLYILNDIVTVKHPSGAEAKYYRKHLTY